MYDYNNIHVVIPVIHLLPSCYSYARPKSIMLQNLPDMFFACFYAFYVWITLTFHIFNCMILQKMIMIRSDIEL